MRRLLRGEWVMVLCALLFLVICTGYWSGRNQTGTERWVTTERDVGVAANEDISERDTPKTLLPGEKIDLTSAPEKDLLRVPGIGTATAMRIVDWRERCGPFETPRDLMLVSGVGWELYTQVEPDITVGQVR